MKEIFREEGAINPFDWAPCNLSSLLEHQNNRHLFELSHTHKTPDTWAKEFLMVRHGVMVDVTASLKDVFEVTEEHTLTWFLPQ